MVLKNKSSLELLSDIKILVKSEKEYTFQILNYLKEIEVRKLYLSHGCSSLFSFCTEFLEYSEPEAMNRIQAMRLMKSIPEVEAQIKSGELSLTSAAYIQTAFRKEDKFRKDKGQTALNVSEKRTIIQKTKNTSTRECQKTLVSFFPESVLKQEKIKPLTSQVTKIEVVVSDELMKKLIKIKNLTAHKNYDGSMEKLLEIMADITLDKVDRNKTIALKVNSQSKENTPNKICPTIKRSRYIPSHIKQFIFNRDKRKCQYIDPLSKKLCSSEYGLELDHKFPYSRGGKTQISNLQLLCTQHNKLKKDIIENSLMPLS